jgi:DNA-binding transcriptional MerR regulator
MEKLLKVSEVSKIVGVTIKTLKILDNEVRKAR